MPTLRIFLYSPGSLLPQSPGSWAVYVGKTGVGAELLVLHPCPCSTCSGNPPKSQELLGGADMTRLPVSAFPELEGLLVTFPLKHGTDPGFLSLSGAETRGRTLRTPAEFTERQRLRCLAHTQMCHVLSVPPLLTWEDTGVALPAVLDVRL